jgi:hypothetical protein
MKRAHIFTMRYSVLMRFASLVRNFVSIVQLLNGITQIRQEQDFQYKR